MVACIMDMSRAVQAGQSHRNCVDPRSHAAGMLARQTVPVGRRAPEST